jgi:hypothetical protein
MFHCLAFRYLFDLVPRGLHRYHYPRGRLLVVTHVGPPVLLLLEETTILLLDGQNNLLSDGMDLLTFATFVTTSRSMFQAFQGINLSEE